MYLLRGSLPWQGFQAKTKEERYKKIKKKLILLLMIYALDFQMNLKNLLNRLED